MEKGEIKNCGMMKTFTNIINEHLIHTYYMPGTILSALPELSSTP